MPIPETSYAMAGDAAIAYQVYGSGEHRVVFVPGVFSNVELFWEWAPFHRYFERWGSFATVAHVRLPDGNGVEVCREVRSEHPEIRCVMLSALDDDEVVAQSTLAGASGFVLKQIKHGHVVDAVRLVARGNVLFDDSRQARVLERADDGPDGHARRIGRLAWPS